MKKSIQIIATALVILLGNVGFSQNDTMYVMKNGYITHSILVDSNHVDSVIFYKPVELANLTTTTISSITETTALSGGNITNNGGGEITSRGICWGTSPNPTKTDNLSANGSGIGSFTSNLTGLTQNTIYYVRAYATNSAGTTYGNEVSFTTRSPIQLATLTTATVSSITETTAVSGGNITNNGGATVTSRGICWGTSPNPTPADNSSVNGSGAGSFSSNLSGLTGGTTYYVRAYAVNSLGTAYGNEVSFITANLPVDVDGNIYGVVTIGTQDWMSENLRTTKYSDGTAITNVTDYTGWDSLYIANYSVPQNDNQYDTIYGKLYNGWAVETGKLCPTGWHVPTDAEWTILTNYLAANGHDGTEGKALKSTSGWNDKDDGTSANGTDDYGWNGLPGGFRNWEGWFGYVGGFGGWWSSSDSYNSNYDCDACNAWSRYLSNSNDYVSRYGNEKEYSHSVRCLRD